MTDATENASALWYDGNPAELAELLDCIEFTATCGDDYKINRSNAARAASQDDLRGFSEVMRLLILELRREAEK